MTDIRMTLERGKLLAILPTRLPGKVMLGFWGVRGAAHGTVELTPQEAREAARALLRYAREADRSLIERINEPGASIRTAIDGEPASYRVAVDYQTSSGAGTRYLNVEACNWDEAFSVASAAVRKRRGVLKVDGGTACGAPITLT